MTEDEEEQECVSGDTRRREYISCIARATALGLGIMSDFLGHFERGKTFFWGGTLQTDNSPNKSRVSIGKH